MSKMSVTGRKIRSSREDMVFEILTKILLIIACLIVLYPLYFIIIASISNPDYVISGKLSLFPVDVTFSGYRKIFKFKNLMNGYKNSFFYAIVGGAVSAALTLFAAYPLSKNDFSGRKPFTIFLLITMFFQV